MKKRLTVKSSSQIKSRMKILLFCLIGIVTARAQNLKILYSSGNNGSLEFCGCPHDRNSGLSGRCSKILQLSDSNTIVLEAGNLLAMNQNLAEMSVISNLLSIKPPDFMAPGINDLPFLKDLFSINYKLLGNNVDKCLKSGIVEKGGVKIGVISAVDPDYNSRFGEVVLPLDFVELKAEISSLSKACDILIFISSLSESQESNLFGCCSAVDILISVNRGEPVSDKFGNRYFTALGRRNAYLGEFTVDTKNAKLTDHRFISVDPDSVQIESGIQSIISEYNLKKLQR